MANFIYRPSMRRFRKGSSGSGILSYATKTRKRWCENHPRSVWGEAYAQCYEGFKKHEPCKEGK